MRYNEDFQLLSPKKRGIPAKRRPGNLIEKGAGNETSRGRAHRTTVVTSHDVIFPPSFDQLTAEVAFLPFFLAGLAERTTSSFRRGELVLEATLGREMVLFPCRKKAGSNVLCKQHKLWFTYVVSM